MARYHDDDDEDHIDMRPLLRLTVWGCGAIIAVGATVLAGRTDVGTARARVALATIRTAPLDLVKHPNDMLASRPAGPDEAEKRLAEEVRTLTADRDRLAERVATLEHNLNDLTGSIARGPAPAANGAATNVAPNSAPNVAPSAPRDDKTDAVSPAAPAAAAEPQMPPINFAGSNDDQARVAAAAPPPAQPQPGIGHPVDVPLPRPGPLATIQSYVYSTSPPAAAPAAPTRLASTNADSPPPPPPQAGDKAYALDLGTATNVNSLRAHWGSVKTAHGALLEGLQPLVSVRQSSRPGFTEFHLVAGPVSDPDAAARLCAALTSVRVPCRPTIYNGQRLELR